MPKIDSSRVAAKYHELIPHVAKLGISDDLERENVFDSLGEEELASQLLLLKKYDSSFDEWLASPEALFTNPTN